MPGFNEAQLRRELHSERAEDLLSRAAGKSFRSRGFDRKEYNKIFGKTDSDFSDSAIGPALPASYYDWADDGFEPEGGMAGPGGGNYSKAGKRQEIQQPINKASLILNGIYNAITSGTKIGIYRVVTQWPVMLRDYVSDRANSIGKLTNFLSSVYPMGGDCGPVERMLDDWNDRLEIIIGEEAGQDPLVLGYRRYTDRDPNAWYVRWLKKEAIERGEKPIQRHGRPVKTTDELEFTDNGQIYRYKETVGGQPLRSDQIRFDDFYSKSETEYWVTHGEINRASPSKFRENAVQWALSHYIYTQGSAKKEFIGKITVSESEGEREREIYRLDMPHGTNWFDWSLLSKTVGEMAIIYVAHFFYSAIENAYLKAGRKRGAQNVAQQEMDFMFGSYKPIKPSIAYG